MSYKSLFTFTGIILCAVLSLGAHAQVSTKAEPYFTSHEMPDMLNWYSSPPKEDSEEFIRDIKRYYWGKSQRLNPERAAIAVRDARYGLGTILREFSIPFGLQLEKKNTPEIYKLLRDALATTDSICNRFFRQMAAARKEFTKLKGKHPPLKYGQPLSNDSAYIEYKKDVGVCSSAPIPEFRPSHCPFLRISNASQPTPSDYINQRRR